MMLSEQIRRFRIARGISQVDLANEMSVTKQSVSNWENNNILPSIEMLGKLADFFGTTTDYMLGRTDKQTIDVSGLTEKQVQHLVLLIADLMESQTSFE